MYVLISLGQAVTRDGFDLVRHEWSLLANGSFGWIQKCESGSQRRGDHGLRMDHRCVD
jgi:hypothetical protein